jgi:predicted unusual protein kinase regulating ubiquinone biosynthesis (AarF/ABC1/UbiB family)
MKLSSSHLRRYKDLAFLFFKYGRGDLATHLQSVHAAFPDAEPATAADASPAQTGEPGRPEQLADDLERMGPTFIKLGQVLAGRPDLLPPEYQAALARLHDRVAPFPYEEVERIVFAELGVRVSKAFAFFNPEPLAAASLGQVHRATLRDGREVVVKIQRPGIRQIVSEDFEVLADIAAFLEKHSETGRLYRFTEMLEEFRLTLRDELNYEQEASNLDSVGRNLADFPRIHVPRPVHDYCSPVVLTMEHMRGRKITALSPLARIELDGASLADELLHAYLKQVLVDGLFHADPHPGNIFITDENHLALIDLGMVGRVAPGLRENLLKLLIHVSEGRGEDAARVLREIAPAAPDFDAVALNTDITRLVARHHDAGLADLNVGRSVLLLDHQARRHGLRPPPELGLLGKALLQLDEAGRTLDPSFQPTPAIRRHLSTLMTSRIRDDLTQGSVLGALLEAKNFAAGLPSRLNRVLDNIGDPHVEVNVKSDDSDRLIDAMQTIGNRISAGVVLASLILGAALLMRVETDFRLLGYPGLAMICFAAAAAGGVWLVLSTLLHDPKKTKKQRPG